MPALKPPVPIPGHIPWSPSLWGTSLEWGGGDACCCTWNKGDQTPAALGPGAGGCEGGEQARSGTAWHGMARRGGLAPARTGGCGHTGQGQMLCQGMDALQRDRCFAGGWMLCEGMDALRGDGCSARPHRHAAEVRGSSGPATGAHAVPPCWDAVISANATSSPHVQAGKITPSIPWASWRPSEPGTSVQGGERPLTHPSTL